MTLQSYADEMGLFIGCDLSPTGFRCYLKGILIADSCGNVEASAEGSTLEEAHTALASFIRGRTLREARRATTLYWVPSDLKS